MKLTDEQIKQAHEAWLDAIDFPSREMSPKAEAAIRAVTPYLQLPWDWPTDEEMECFMFCPPGLKGALRQALIKFIDRRNAALLPKPVDPRKSEIVAALIVYRGLNDDDMADRILAALDEVK